MTKKFLNETVDKMGSIIYTASREDTDGKPITDVHIKGTLLEEQKVEADAVSGVVTFSQNVKFIGIYNRDSADGVFNVNGIDITMPGGESEVFQVSGTPSKEVTITGATSYILSRYS